MTWFIIFFLVLLKIPVLWLAYVIWWALKKQPELPQGDGGSGGSGGGPGPQQGPPAPWWRPRARRARLRGDERQLPSRRPVPAGARAENPTIPR